MSMTNYPYNVWNLHRKLHHRYLRFQRCFEEAEEGLEEYQAALDAQSGAESAHSDGGKKSDTLTVCLMSDSATDTEEENVEAGVEESATAEDVEESGTAEDVEERSASAEDVEESDEEGDGDSHDSSDDA